MTGIQLSRRYVPPSPFDLYKDMYFFQIVGDLLKLFFAQNTTTQWGEIFSEGAFLFNEPTFS